MVIQPPKNRSTNFVPSFSWLVDKLFAQKEIKAYIDNWISVTFKQKIWKINRILTKQDFRRRASQTRFKM